MSKKIYIHMQEEGYPSQTSKIQVPKTWTEKTVTDVIKLFSDAYNKKNPDFQLELNKIHFATKEGEKIYSNDLVGSAIEDLSDYYIKFGIHVRESLVEVVDKDAIRCKNYGCNQYYKEVDNHDVACCHHTGPPVFHDTAKYWSCCADRKAYDFETFQTLTGCATGRHSNTAQQVTIAASPNAVAMSEAPPTVLKSIADFNTTNPTAATAASSAIKSTERKSTRNADGTARCQRKGCQKTFKIEENSATSCVHHVGNPVFHDAVKVWSCCPDKKCYDFDEFLAVPGCAVGWHDDGVLDV
ncbi:hypothetical protein EON63_11035 [archaeon]|nr:MAG: hypothetical protein EON63_11035 [archaeon]